MSKASKLDRMRNTVLESTGLKYTPSGETVELNFFPDSTDSGVSVPLVLKGNTNNGVCPATTTPPLLGYPYAHIVDSKVYSAAGGTFTNTNSSAGIGGFQLRGGDTSTQYYRSRDFTERKTDEIGVSMVEAPNTGNDDGGPGTFLNFPTGTYYLRGSAPSYQVGRNTTYWCNFTKANAEAAASTERNTYLLITGTTNYSANGSGSIFGTQTRSTVEGRFTVTDNNDSYLLLHGAGIDSTNQGFGVQGSAGTYDQPTKIIFSELQIWKIG